MAWFKEIMKGRDENEVYSNSNSNRFTSHK